MKEYNVYEIGVPDHYDDSDNCVSKYRAYKKLYRIRYKEVKNTCPLSYQL